MHFSNRGPMAVALMAGLACASPLPLLDANANAENGVISANVELDVQLQEEILVAGVLADVVVDPILGAAAAAEVAVLCHNCYVHGSVDASISLEKVVPALSLTLKDIEAYLDLDIQIGAAATIAVNLFTPEDLIKLSLPGLDVEAMIFLDLVLGVHTAIDLSAGLYVELVDEAHLDTDILAGKILEASFTGLSVVTLPVTVRVGCTELMADLRLRVQLAAGLDLEVDEILPILDVVPDIGAGVEAAVYANLVEYVGLFCDTPACPLSEESYGLNIGAAVGLNVEVENVATLNLAPSLSTTLLTMPTHSICEHGPRPSGDHSVTISTNIPGLPTGGVPPYAPSVGVPTDAPSVGVPTDAPSVDVPTGPGATGPGGYPVKTTPAPVAPTATGPNGGQGGYVTSEVEVPQTYIVTVCGAHVANCPAQYQEEKTVVHTVVYTTVCPATETITTIPPPPKATTEVPPPPPPSTTLTTTSCEETFVPPTPAYPTEAPAYPTN